jgi:hypothetical protein
MATGRCASFSVSDATLGDLHARGNAAGRRRVAEVAHAVGRHEGGDPQSETGSISTSIFFTSAVLCARKYGLTRWRHHTFSVSNVCGNDYGYCRF